MSRRMNQVLTGLPVCASDRLHDAHAESLIPFVDEISQAGCRIVHQEVRWGEILAEVRAK